MKKINKVWASVIGVVAVALISFAIYKVNASPNSNSQQEQTSSQTKHKTNQISAKSNVAKTGKVLPAKK